MSVKRKLLDSVDEIGYSGVVAEVLTLAREELEITFAHEQEGLHADMTALVGILTNTLKEIEDLGSIAL